MKNHPELDPRLFCCYCVQGDDHRYCHWCGSTNPEECPRLPHAAMSEVVLLQLHVSMFERRVSEYLKEKHE